MGNRVRRNLGILLLIWLAPLGTTAATDCKPWAARIVSAQGEIEVKQASTSNWHPVNRNDTFCPGDSIRVGNNSRAAIVLANETLLRLDQNSAIKLTQFETELPSILEFIMGIGHFISRVPRSLKIETATVNAAIEGTEFVVSVSADETSVTVFEGTVLTQNQKGEMRITDGETVLAKANAAPFKTLLAKPRNTVQWALYFPPVVEMDDSNSLFRASQLLSVGRVNEAESLLHGMDSGEALALQAIIAIVNNEQERAFKLATDAVQQAPQSAATHIAMSYAWQAKLDLKQALASAQQAVKHEPDNAIAWARLAELQLSTGNLNKALASAQQATLHNANLSRTQTILGFAYLVRIDIDEAMAAFNRAIELDQVDPLPRLGLGLARIRKGHLTEGRRELEIAASLDPNNAIIRSYLGKAYFEEKRGPLDAEQFAMAKALDPTDPTPWLYDAIRKQTENNPVGALEDINKSIELNDNRAIYRSSLQLDQDEAARSVSQARIYQDLGFDQPGLNEAYLSLNSNPNNFSAHRFLADAYSTIPRHEIALASELLQSTLTQPSIYNPPRPQLLSTAKNIINDTRVSSSFNEYGSLFFRDGTNFLLDAAAGSNNTLYDNLILSGNYGIHSYSLSQFHYETDGYRPNNDFTQDIVDIRYHLNPSSNDRLIFSYTEDDTEEGDIKQSIIPDSESTSFRRAEDNATAKFGYAHTFNERHEIIFSAIHQQRDVLRTKSTSISLGPGIDFVDDSTRTIDNSADAAELQFNGKTSEKINYTLGVGSYWQQTLDDETILSTLFFAGSPIPQPTDPINLDYTIRHQNAYLYTHINLNKDNTLILGLSADSFEDNNPIALYDKNIINPKIGYIYNATKNTTVKFAAFQALKRSLISNQTIEPTQIAGFNQYFDDLNGAVSKRYGVAIDHSFNYKTSAGLELSSRDVDSPSETIFINGETIAIRTDRDEEVLKTYLYWAATQNITAGISPSFENQSRSFTEGLADNSRPSKINGIYIPINIGFTYSNGINIFLLATHIDQSVEFPALSGVSDYKSKTWLLDAEISYRLPKRFGKISFLIKNITDENELFQDTNLDGEPRQTTLIPEATYQLNFVLSF